MSYCSCRDFNGFYFLVVIFVVVVIVALRTTWNILMINVIKLLHGLLVWGLGDGNSLFFSC